MFLTNIQDISERERKRYISWSKTSFTLNFPTMRLSSVSSVADFFPLYSSKVCNQSLKPSNSAWASNSLGYTYKQKHPPSKCITIVLHDWICSSRVSIICWSMKSEFWKVPASIFFFKIIKSTKEDSIWLIFFLFNLCKFLIINKVLNNYLA